MSIIDEMYAEAAALLKLADARDRHTDSLEKAFRVAADAPPVTEKSAGIPIGDYQHPYTGSGIGDGGRPAYTGGGTPFEGVPSPGSPGGGRGSSTSSFKSGSGSLTSLYDVDLKAGADWVAEHCFLSSTQIPDPSQRYASLGEVPMVTIPVWDCRAAMKNVDALFVPEGVWEGLAKSTSKVGRADSPGGGGATATAGGSGGIKGGPSGAGLYGDPNNPNVAPPPTSQGQKIVIQEPTAPTVGESAIVRELRDQGKVLARIARAAEAPMPSDGLGLRRAAKL